MAKEYIERDAALKEQKTFTEYDEGGWDAAVRAVPVDAIKKIPAADVVEVKWIPVTERLPEMKADVLMYFAPDKNMAAGFMCDVDEDKTMWCAYTDGGFYTDCDFEPTHWMPLPEPPKDGGAE